MFHGRKLVIATMHNKQTVIAPAFEKELGVKCITPTEFNSDLWGTFSGEIERVWDPVTTARKKCQMAMSLTNADLAIASEGSFGMHPSIAFLNADDEILVFKDIKNDLEIVVREISTSTNFSAKYCNSLPELKEFATKALFPSHALILRPSSEAKTEIIKGINQWDQLTEMFSYYQKNYGGAFVETDMRAMYNPTRMAVIQHATRKLLKKINTLCPMCNTPGFEITDTQQGLPCESCTLPTRSTLYFIHTCRKCSFTKSEKFPHKKFTEDPMYCDYCNP